MQRAWIDFDKRQYCQICHFIFVKQNQQIDKKLLRQHLKNSTIHQYAIEKMREVYFSVRNLKYRTIEEMINQLQKLKGKTNLKLKKTIRKHYDEMNYLRQKEKLHFEDDALNKSAQAKL